MTNQHTPNGDDQQCASTTAYRHTFDWQTDSVSGELVKAVAALTNSEPTELPVLADSVDPDALDNLFRNRADGRPRDTDGRLVFDYDGHRVRITTDGTIAVDAAESPSGD
ncbi:HalOD1 output domain-containing protein [Haloprofundus sp. MHR1]|uniref:HalOD1 output domain-containing protein n=1 Tax=Haloprofundus sp. MHR1 TaxID=2572921 RepID=UPI00143CEC9F|nr:HalOD1 output domain-containing protein [Haloprofundus sp. MHR1]